MTKRKPVEPEALRFAKLALKQFMANNDGVPPECGFLAGFALALGYTRLVGMPTAAEQETVSAEALRWTGRPVEELETDGTQDPPALRLLRQAGAEADHHGVALHSMSETTRQKNGNWYRHLYLDAPVRSIADCRRHSNQQVISVHYGMDKTISRFAEWDGESYWQSSDPCCSITCARKFARAAYKAGYRMTRQDAAA